MRLLTQLRLPVRLAVLRRKTGKVEDGGDASEVQASERQVKSRQWPIVCLLHKIAGQVSFLLVLTHPSIWDASNWCVLHDSDACRCGRPCMSTHRRCEASVDSICTTNQPQNHTNGKPRPSLPPSLVSPSPLSPSPLPFPVAATFQPKGLFFGIYKFKFYTKTEF